MTRTLTMTSPLMRGDDVKQAQQKLVRAKFLRAAGVDGVFGAESARACGLAHWDLGFPPLLAHLTTYGDLLDKVLDSFLKDGEDGLAVDYRKRRKKRLAGRTMGQRALAYLKTHVGETENPAGSNRVEWASLWYLGYGAPWCAMAATRAYVEAGSTALARGVRYAFVPYIVADAGAGANGLLRTYDPKPGDLVCFDWGGTNGFDHVGLVDKPPANVYAGASFTTVEGNTSSSDSGDQSNGGGCFAKTRTVLGGGRTVFVRVLR